MSQPSIAELSETVHILSAFVKDLEERIAENKCEILELKEKNRRLEKITSRMNRQQIRHNWEKKAASIIKKP